MHPGSADLLMSMSFSISCCLPTAIAGLPCPFLLLSSKNLSSFPKYTIPQCYDSMYLFVFGLNQALSIRPATRSPVPILSSTHWSVFWSAIYSSLDIFLLDRFFLRIWKCIIMYKHIHLFSNCPLALWKTTLPACLPRIKLFSWELLSFIEEYMTDWLNGLHTVKHVGKRFVRKSHGGCGQVDAAVTGEKEKVNILEGHKVTMRVGYWPSSPWMSFFHTWWAARSMLLFNTYRVGFISVIRCASQRQSYVQVCGSHTAHNGSSESRQRLSP